MAFNKPVKGERDWATKLNGTLDDLKERADGAQTTADSATTLAEGAQSTATAAQSAASAAQTTANSASATANAAETPAGALAKANSALASANSYTDSEIASEVTRADGKYETPSGAQAKVDTLSTSVNAALADKLDVTVASNTYAPVQAAPTSASVTGIYDRSLNAYNVKPSNTRRLRAYLGRARSQSTFVKLAFAGDSTIAGLGSTGPDTGSWPVQLRALLAAAGYPSGGTGLVSVNTHTAATNDPRWALNTTQWAEFTSGYYQFRRATTSGVTATFTSDVAGDTVQVFYLDTSAAFTVSIDGGAPMPVTPGGTLALTGATYGGLPNTTHTVAVTTSSASAVYLLGCEVRATGGVSLWNAGISSSMSSHWADSNFYGPAKLVAAWAPAATFLCLGINDAVNAVPVATYKANMSAVIDTLQAGPSDVFLLAPTPTTTSLSAYVDALYELADSQDVPLIDMQARWGSWSTANGLGIMYDSNHPNSGGYGDIAASVAKVVVP